MRTIHKALLLLEVVVCFAPMTWLWVIGALLTPFVVLSSYEYATTEFWQGPALLLGFDACGLCGLASLVYVLGKLLGRQRPVARPAIVLAGAALGVLPILPFVLIPEWGKLFALAPIVVTAHLLYLSRKMLFPPLAKRASGRDANEPVGSPRGA